MDPNVAKRDPRTYAIIGGAMEVHRQLGRGFLEAVYREALISELASRAIPFQCECDVPIFYKGKQLSMTYRADLICFNSVVVELKAIAKLTAQDEAQLLNYLKATQMEVGLLLNFGSPSLEYKRMVFSPSVKSAQSADSFPNAELGQLR